MVQIRHLFAGSNSGEGFYSLFDNIIGPGAKKVYLLKGGPGTGKSSFMKYVADTLARDGYNQELFFCSSDSGALDAVSFPDLGVALLDATAPHSQDGDLPGCRDQLICLGDFWSGQALEEKRDEITLAGAIKKSHFARAWRYFSAANCVEENMASSNKNKALDCTQELEEILSQVHQGRGHVAKRGKARHLFASALTPEGYVSHIRGLVQDYNKIYILTGAPGTGRDQYLERIVDCALGVGLELEVYRYPLNPRRLLHVIIPSLGLAVITSTFLEPLEDLHGSRIDCGQSLDQDADKGDHKLREELLNQGFMALQEAQASHIGVEEFYAGAMNFKALTAYRDAILVEILSYKNFS